MKAVIRLLGAMVLAIAIVALFAWSGAYNVAADEPHWSLTEAILGHARDRSIASRTAEIVVPDLGDDALITAGAGNYDAMCAGCHLRPGMDGSEISAGLYPVPPSLVQSPVNDPARAFWVIKHGIKMTGMPAWGKSMGDEHIWGMVAFLRRLPDLTVDGYGELVASSGGHSHGDAEPAPDAEVHEHTHDTPHEH